VDENDVKEKWSGIEREEKLEIKTLVGYNADINTVDSRYKHHLRAKNFVFMTVSLY
jgi:hypothetical protein